MQALLVKDEAARPLYFAEVPSPAIAAGVIVEKGLNVAGWQTGDRVCRLLGGGGYAEYVAVHQDMLLPIPAPLNFEQAAAIPEDVNLQT